ncbi:DUF4956 domain-containing protein [Planctomicrobium sp. SH668]|uniref:DUF4956 domain-containing protein n=1 Tax=Planctomicrobium sp. SH668 TaxID=3448126 RepID=UPI003F5BA91A
MPEWLTVTGGTEGAITTNVLIFRILAALVYGIGVALIYRLSHGREEPSPSMLTATLILLSVLIAMVSMTIGNSVARAFSLVGALSIVRFRTVVDDTRDTAFVIFSVIVGMAAGTGLLLVPIVGMPVVAAAAILLSHAPTSSKSNLSIPCKLSIRLALGKNPQAELDTVFQTHFARIQLTSASTARQGAAMDLEYRGELKSTDSMTEIVGELNRLDGVMGVELNRINS